MFRRETCVPQQHCAIHIHMQNILASITEPRCGISIFWVQADLLFSPFTSKSLGVSSKSYTFASVSVTSFVSVVSLPGSRSSRPPLASHSTRASRPSRSCRSSLCVARFSLGRLSAEACAASRTCLLEHPICWFEYCDMLHAQCSISTST